MRRSIAVAVTVCALAVPARADDRAGKLAKLMTAIKHRDTKAFTPLVVAPLSPQIAPQAAGYDALLVAKIRAWKLKPFLYDGKPTPACAMYQFQPPAH